MTPAISQANLPADWRDLYALTKPGVMRLVVFTGLCGMLAAPAMPPLALGFTAILCIALGAGAVCAWAGAAAAAPSAASRIRTFIGTPLRHGL